MPKVKLILEKEGIEKTINIPNYETILRKEQLIFDTKDTIWKGTYKVKKVEQLLVSNGQEGTLNEAAYITINLYLKRNK